MNHEICCILDGIDAWYSYGFLNWMVFLFFILFYFFSNTEIENFEDPISKILKVPRPKIFKFSSRKFWRSRVKNPGGSGIENPQVLRSKNSPILISKIFESSDRKFCNSEPENCQVFRSKILKFWHRKFSDFHAENSQILTLKIFDFWNS